MWNKIIRIALTVLIFCASIWQFVESNIGNGIFLLVLSSLILLSYFRNENMIMALWYLRSQKFDKVKKWLSRIKNPEQSLIKSQAAYYYLLQGLVKGQEQNLNEAEKNIKKAMTLGLRMKTDEAMACLQMAGIALAKRRKTEANMWINKAKQLDQKKLLADQIKQIKTLANRI
ncbi:hypothetical protein [Schleiferia thermophila]|jgi:hypothetical protein|uniref:DUF2892 domain-containing protein n=1 Tax=Schleiferia thermophila TaxID=884107 RepID=A0A369A3B2_9FLAO|nr:hypothetical protein [Schleiferia thermophila]KFD39645.1 membrane protein [Schleiferia thermophila str. Yellowstone]RCX03802.1 hypothetical protein DES35_102258 [Schleiferia thermophila]GCD80034.1 membrane protein [Schleiferia thermophila]